MRNGKQNMRYSRGKNCLDILPFIKHTVYSTIENTEIVLPHIRKQTPLTGVFLYWVQKSQLDQLHNLSDCVLCSLPLFLMVTDSSWKPPLTLFEATSCRNTWQGACSSKKVLNQKQFMDNDWSNPSDSGSLTMPGSAGASLGGSSSVEEREVKSKLDLTEFPSVGPRSIGWSVLVRLMVLWVLNGREGWSLSQSACRQRKGKNGMCVCTHKGIV